MKGLDPILFNLLFNSICSFFAGLLVVTVFIHLFKIGATRWRLAILSLPFLKILVDIWRGIPKQSFIFTGLDPWLLPPHSKTLSIGAGFSYYGPIFNLAFTAKDTSGTEHAISVADFAAAWLSRNIYSDLPYVMPICFLVVSGFLIVRRLIAHISFEIQRRRELARGVESIVVPRTVPQFRKPHIYFSNHFSGTPFTGGILQPYICFPRDTYSILTSDERQAVIQHEIAHVRSWDCLTTAIIKFLGDLFWFVPGYRWLSLKIDRLREILADRDAVRVGARPESLASALVKMKEIVLGTPHLVLYSAFIRSRPLLKDRVNYLLAPQKMTARERLGWNWKWWRPVLAFWIFGAVMVATLGGNHEIEIRPASPWLQNLFSGASR